MAVVNIIKDRSGRLVLTSPYDPARVVKIKTIPGHRWHPEKKHWSFPDTDGTLKKILRVFEGEKNSYRPYPAGDCPRFTDEAKRSRRIGTVPEAYVR